MVNWHLSVPHWQALNLSSYCLKQLPHSICWMSSPRLMASRANGLIDYTPSSWYRFLATTFFKMIFQSSIHCHCESIQLGLVVFFSPFMFPRIIDFSRELGLHIIRAKYRMWAWSFVHQVRINSFSYFQGILLYPSASCNIHQKLLYPILTLKYLRINIFNILKAGVYT